MLTLKQLAINSLNEFDLQQFIEFFNEKSGELCQVILYSEIFIENKTNNTTAEKSPNQNIDQVIREEPIHSLTNNIDKSDWIEVSVQEVVDIMHDISQMSDLLLQRFEKSYIESICGHRCHEILANKHISDELPWF